MPNGGILAGGGQVVLSDSTNNIVTGGAVTNKDNTVSGAGLINPSILINGPGGVIDGSGTNNALVISTGSPVTNVGVLQSTGAGGLDIKDTVENFDGIDPPGLIQATGAGHVDLDGGAIGAGVLATSGSGKIDTKSGAVGTIDNVFNTGLFVISDNSTLQVDGDITGAVIALSDGTLIGDVSHQRRVDRVERRPDGREHRPDRRLLDRRFQALLRRQRQSRDLRPHGRWWRQRGQQFGRDGLVADRRRSARRRRRRPHDPRRYH
jgi:hypothetical protein